MAGIEGAKLRAANTGPETSLVSNYLEDGGVGAGFVIFWPSWGTALTWPVLEDDTVGYEQPSRSEV